MLCLYASSTWKGSLLHGRHLLFQDLIQISTPLFYPFSSVEHNLPSTSLPCTYLYGTISLCCNDLVLYLTKLLDYHFPDFTNFVLSFTNFKFTDFILGAFLVSSSKHIFDDRMNVLLFLKFKVYVHCKIFHNLKWMEGTYVF